MKRFAVDVHEEIAARFWIDLPDESEAKDARKAVEQMNENDRLELEHEVQHSHWRVDNVELTRGHPIDPCNKAPESE